MVSNYDRSEKLHNGLYISISKLNLSTSPDYFHNGLMKVTCQAVISIGRPKTLPPPQEYKREAILLGKCEIPLSVPLKYLFSIYNFNLSSKYNYRNLLSTNYG